MARPVPALTFGVELEFPLGTLPEGADIPDVLLDGRTVSGISGTTIHDQQHTRDAYLNVQTHIANTLQSHGIKATSCIAHGDDDTLPPGHWMIDYDLSLSAPKDSFIYYQIEVKSPILYSTDRCIEEVKKVAEILITKYHTNINRSWGLHIHVGNRLDGLLLEALKNLMAYLWTLESQLSTIHPSHRRWHDYSDEAMVMSRSLWRGTLMGLFDKLKNRKQGLEKILQAEDFKELYCLVGSDSRPNYAVRNLIQPFRETVKRTIEFREHEGTLDPERIEHWIRVCTGIVKYARDAPSEEVRKFCKEHVDKGLKKCGLGKVLAPLGVEDSKAFYEGRILRDEIEPKGEREELFFIKVEEAF
jgi:hypothetical protein